MSEHRIDDIFKRGLEDQQHDVPPEHWEGAREMLGLDKKRRRIIPFWWIGGIAASLLILFVTLQTSGVIGKDKDIGLVNVITPENGVEVAVTEIADKQTNEDLTSKEDQEKSQSDNLSLPSSQANEITKSKEVTVVEQGKIDNKAAAEKTNAVKRARNQTLIDGAVKKDDIASAIDPQNSKKSNDLFPSIRNTQAPATISVNARNIVIPSDDNVEVVVDSDEAEKLSEKGIQSVVVQSEQAESSIKLEALLPVGYLALSPLEVETPQIAIPVYLEKVTAEKTKPLFKIGTYVGLNVINEVVPAIGLFGELKWSNNLFANIGLGFNYQANVKTFQEGMIGVNNNRGQPVALLNASAEEYIVSDLYKLEMPIHVGYQTGRHHMFTGLLLDYPIYTVSSIESELTFDPQDMSVDPAAPDMMGTGVPSVLTAEKIINAADLQKINVQFRLGYGYAISKKLRLEIVGGYKLNSRELVTSSIVSSPNFTPLEMIESLPSSKFTGGLFLRYQFGR